MKGTKICMKGLVLMLALILIILPITVYGATTDAPVRGDVNGDGVLTVTDLSLIKLHLTGGNLLTGERLKAADINRDGNITQTDSTQLKLLIVGFELPIGDPFLPTVNGPIIIVPSTTGATKNMTVAVTWPSDEVVNSLIKEISTDGGNTYTEYVGPITLSNNAEIIARLTDENGNVIKKAKLVINNIDNIAPDAFTITAESTSSVITVSGTTIDRTINAAGEEITDGIAGIAKYMYKIDEQEWQESNIFAGIESETTHNVTAKAIDYSGNETVSDTISIQTKAIPTAEGNVNITYEPTELTKDGVTAKFNMPEEWKGFYTEYQIGGTTGEWQNGSSYIAEENCTLYVRVVNEKGEENSSGGYLTGNIMNIDKLAPLGFEPTFTKTDTNITINAQTTDAPENEFNASSGILGYRYVLIDVNGKVHTSKGGTLESSGEIIADTSYTFTFTEVKDYTIIVEAYDKVLNLREETRSTNDEFVGEEGSLGEGNINDGESNVTVNGGANSAYNPLVPVGFMAVNTPDASWKGVTPNGWNNGLVIEDINLNQFVWVPVPVRGGDTPVQAIDRMMYDMRNVEGEGLLYTSPNYEKDHYELRNIIGEEIPSAISNEEITYEQGKFAYRTEIVEQVKKYQGFYIARYEAGNSNGNLASKRGVMPIGSVTYDQAKAYAESMYNTQYVTSGLVTGTQWDLMVHWTAQKSGFQYVNHMGLGAECRGNVIGSEYTFSGLYSEGPYGGDDRRGEVKEGTNIHKVSGDRTLLGTGQVERFKLNNIYDLYGNVWEHTSEIAEYYAVSKITGEVSPHPTGTGHNVRGAEYYWDATGVEGPGGVDLGIYYRCIVGEGDARNEGGFRVTLFLSESKAETGKIVEHNSTVDGGKARYNNPVIPAGFKPINTENANWGNGTTPAVDWNNGLVIEDARGNQFVWVPVDKTSVKYATWTEGSGAGYSYRDMEGSETPSGWDEDSQIARYGGFYIARYEASADPNGGAQTKVNAEVRTDINYSTAKSLAEGVETARNVKVGLVTGKQWDTAMRWIANELGEDAVLVNSSAYGNYSGRMTQTGAHLMKNISSLAGNAWEWTSENYQGKKVYRGGVCTGTGDSAAAYRGAYEENLFDAGTSFRMALFVTGDVSNISEQPVEESAQLIGGSTQSPSGIPPVISDVRINANGNTVDVTFTLSSHRELYGPQVTFYVDGRVWATAGGFNINEKTITISKKLMGFEGNRTYNFMIGAGVRGDWTPYTTTITTGDSTKPNTFTPEVKVEGNKIEISANTADLGSGIKEYEYYRDESLYCVSGNTAIMDNLDYGRTYEIFVMAVDNNGNKTPSKVVRVTTGGDSLREGTYVKARIVAVKGAELPKAITSLDGTEVVVRISKKTGVSVLGEYGIEKMRLADIVDQNTSKEYIATVERLTEHARILSGTGTESDPYVSDGILQMVVYVNKLQ